jgi:hypothetical protein
LAAGRIFFRVEHASEGGIVSPIIDTVASFFEANSWPFNRAEDESVLMTGYQGESGKWPCFAWTHEEQKQFVFYSVCPVSAPEAKRSAVAEFITRANFEMIIGNFELDFEDGEIRFKTSIDVQEDRLTIALVQQMVIANVVMMDRYLSGLLQVISSDVAPKDALAAIERRSPRDQRS